MNLSETKKTIEKYSNLYECSLILNPTENIPFQTEDSLDFLEGMYIPEEKRDENSKVIFAGRKSLNELYTSWCHYLNAADVSFKPHSGLDAHISVFMALGQIGEKILLLPETAGGHFSTHNILKRLGFQVREFPICCNEYKVDIEKSKNLITRWKPDYIFIDRSEGLYYEDFSWLKTSSGLKIFDASQYLTNIMAKDYENPFDMGFDIILTSMHKNYPGTQKAAVFFRKKDSIRNKILKGLSIYISNIHPKDVCSLLLNLPSESILKEYSRNMLNIAQLLDKCLMQNGLPVIKRNFEYNYTQHIWVRPSSKEEAYLFFQKLENVGILTNYRLLPYNLGYGLRLGTAAAVRQGLTEDYVSELANLISEVYHREFINDTIKKSAKALIKKIKG